MSMKRKAADAEPAMQDGAGSTITDHVEARKAKRRAVKATRKAAAHADEGNIDERRSLNLAIGQMDAGILADHLFRQLKRAQESASDAEVEAMRVPQSAFRDSSPWEQSRSLDSLAPYIQRFSALSEKELSKAPKTNGSPHTIVICSAAIRAADVARALRLFQGNEGRIGKLFAKHIKLKEAIDFTKKTRLSIGIGTPQRLNDLISSGALSLQQVRRVIIDGSWCGLKKRTIFEQPDALIPMALFLGQDELRSRYGGKREDHVEILVF